MWAVLVVCDSGQGQPILDSRVHLGDVHLNTQDLRPLDEELSSITREQLISGSWELIGEERERNRGMALAHSKQQRSLLQGRAAYPRCTCGPWEVDSECPSAGEQYGHFSSISVNGRMVLQMILRFIKPSSETWQMPYALVFKAVSIHLILPHIISWSSWVGTVQRLPYWPVRWRGLSEKYLARRNGWMWWYESPSMLKLDLMNSKVVTWVLPASVSASSWWAMLWVSSKQEMFSVKMDFHFLTKCCGQSCCSTDEGEQVVLVYFWS